MYLSIIIPAYNEEENLKKNILDSIFDFLNIQTFIHKWEIIIVNDGSNDKTWELLQKKYKNKKNVILINNPHYGKASALISGYKKSKGNFILFTDFDQATPLSELNKFQKYFQKHDIIVGVQKDRQNLGLSRTITAKGFILLRFLIIGLPYRDTQSGFKLFQKKALQKIIPKTSAAENLVEKKHYSTDVSFDLEIFILAHKMKLKIKQQEVLWKHEPKKINMIKLVNDAIIELAKVKIKLIKGDYE